MTTRLPTSGADEWRGGWLDRARHCPSPNRGPRPPGTVVELVLIHSISLPPGEYGGDAIERLFTNRLDWDAHPYFQQIRGLQVSSHFVVRRQGDLLQFVDTDERAWHAGESTWQGRSNCNDYSVGIELEGLEGGTFEAPQYASLARLIENLRMRHPIGSLAGHEHVAPGRKADPGAGLNWPLLQSLLRSPALEFPAGVVAAD